jgi:hypothetical protein
MTSSSTRATSTVGWSIQPVSVAGLNFAVARLEVRLYLAPTSTGQPDLLQLAWLDTGAPLSVIPFHVQQKGLRWQPLPGVRTTWSGQRCDLGHIDVWLPTDQPPHRRGSFSLLAKFPQSDPPGDDVPVLLGLEFFLIHQAEFQLLLPTQDGRILLP